MAGCLCSQHVKWRFNMSAAINTSSSVAAVSGNGFRDFTDRVNALKAGIAVNSSTSDHAKLLRGSGPDNPIAESFALAELTGEQPVITLFWGPHPDRASPGKAEKRTLAAIAEIPRLAGIDSDPVVRVILADSHGTFNRIANPSYLTAVGEMTRAVLGDNGEPLELSRLYAEYDLPTHPDPVSEIPNTAPDHPIYADLVRGARNRDQDEEHGLRYAAMRLQEATMINELSGPTGILAVIGDNNYQPLFQNVNGVVYTRAKAKSGAKFIDQAPWIRK